MKSKVNNVWLGTVLGLLVPAVAVFLAYKIRFGHYGFGEFVHVLTQNKILSSLLSLCVIPNLLVFLIFIWLNFLYSARGVLLSTFIVGFIIVGIKFLL
jgi:mannose/fructose/N-acetylgalactosamine-specific phosphotransferase system component IID